MSADALQVYRGLEVTRPGAATAAEQAQLEHRLLSFVDPRETFSAGEFAARAHAEIDAALAAGRRPIVVGGTGLYLQAALTDLELRPPPDAGRCARASRPARRRGPRGAARRARRARARERAAAIDPRDRTRVSRALELLEMGEQPAPSGRRTRGSGPRGCATRRCCAAWRWSARRSTSASTREWTRWWRRARPRRSRAPTRPARRARRAPRSASRSSWRRRRGHEAAHAQLREAPADLDAPAARRAPDRRSRARVPPTRPERIARILAAQPGQAASH